MKRVIMLWLGALVIPILGVLMLGALACGSDNPPPPPTPQVAVPPMPNPQMPQMPQMPNPQMPQMPQMPMPQMPQMPMPQPTGGSNFGTVALTAGFMPDPHVAQGTSGGNLQASTWQAGCTGWVTQQPDHLFVASSPFSNLKIMANSAQDVTLVVQTPTGQYMCNDDSQGTNPMVQGAFAPGTYRIWVGSYQQGANSPYRLGFSELASVMPSNLQ